MAQKGCMSLRNSCSSAFRGIVLAGSLLLIALEPLPLDAGESPAVDGYRGIWFTLGQRFEHGDKYSGGLGTYTAKHHPLAVYSKQADKTFFVFGGTTRKDERHLLAMVGYYDHKTGRVPKPRIVHDKEKVNDPHDNPSLVLDGTGHLWVFVSGRGRKRPGFIYRSVKPGSIDAFEQVKEWEFTYPQPWWTKDQGFLLMFTRYTDGRELYCARSADGRQWGEAAKLVQGGHYQMSHGRDGRVITAFNTHVPQWNVDSRSNLYFMQTKDWGESWETIDGRKLKLPLESVDNPALIRDYRAEKRRVYVKDIQFDAEGRPVLLYITSASHEPGPKGEPRTWTLAHWKGESWAFHEITRSTHNYDMGSLYIEPDGAWRVIGPTGAGPQRWGTGGEVAVWTSSDEGATWKQTRQVTSGSTSNHGYVRRPVNAHPDFYGLWADGNPDKLSISHLYFTNREGTRTWRLPYDMKQDFAKPERVFE